MRLNLLMLALCAAPVFAADPLAAFYDDQLKGVERDVTSLAGAMPANKYDFAPTNGAFTVSPATLMVTGRVADPPIPMATHVTPRIAAAT